MTTLTGPVPTRASSAGAPSHPGLRERKKEETRVAIHEAALRLVAENGAANASVDAICSEAGVSTRTFFNYFPSKVSAIVGLSSFQVTDAQRASFLERAGEPQLVHDLCVLVGEIMDDTARSGADREAIRALLGRRPEIAPDVVKLATELRLEIVQLAEHRTTPERAQLAVALVMSAVDCALHRPLDADPDQDFTAWLLSAVATMHSLAATSLD